MGMPMLLTIDVSNTTIKAGVFRGDALLADWRFATERQKLADEYAILLLNLFRASDITVEDIRGVSISCGVPPLRAVFDQLSRQYLRVEPLMVGPHTRSGVTLSVDNPSEVGADRVVNAAATHHLYGGPAIAIAFGTATVFDCVSAHGEYLGGAIAPGIVTALESLTRSAAQLYQVELRPSAARHRHQYRAHHAVRSHPRIRGAGRRAGGATEGRNDARGGGSAGSKSHRHRRPGGGYYAGNQGHRRD